MLKDSFELKQEQEANVSVSDFIFASKEKIEMIQDHIAIYNELYIDRIEELNKEIKSLELEHNEIKEYSLKKKIENYQQYISSVSKSYGYDFENLNSQKFKENIFSLDQELVNYMEDPEKSESIGKQIMELYLLKAKVFKLFKETKHDNLQLKLKNSLSELKKFEDFYENEIEVNVDVNASERPTVPNLDLNIIDEFENEEDSNKVEIQKEKIFYNEEYRSDWEDANSYYKFLTGEKQFNLLTHFRVSLQLALGDGAKGKDFGIILRDGINLDGKLERYLKKNNIKVENLLSILNEFLAATDYAERYDSRFHKWIKEHVKKEKKDKVQYRLSDTGNLWILKDVYKMLERQGVENNKD